MDYVAEGGGLLMSSEYLSFTGTEAKANYKNTILAKVLLVNMLDIDNRVELPQGCKAINTAAEHVITRLASGHRC